MTNDHLKFRVWDKAKKRYYPDAALVMDVNGDVYDDPGDRKPKKLSPPDYVVERCTGLKDGNGRLIYEGDVDKRFGQT